MSMKKTILLFAAITMAAVTFAQQPTVSASKVTLMYCKTTKGTLIHEGVPFTWGEETFTKPGAYVRTLENARGCDSILTIKVQAPEGAGIATFPITTPACYVATGNLIWTSTGTHNTADGNYTSGTFGIQNPSYASPASGWRETFSYGTSGYNGKSPSTSVDYTSSYSQFPISQNISGTYYDWGIYNSITIEGGKCEVGRWRAMTIDEYAGLFSRARAAQVEGVNGAIVLPDNWVAPEGLEVKNTNDYAQNVFNAAEWAQLEQSGAIFFKNGAYNTTQIKGGRDANWYIELSGTSYTRHDNNKDYNDPVNDARARYVRLIYVPKAQ